MILLSGRNIKFWESVLVCPFCKGKLTIQGSKIICENSHGSFSIQDNVPCFIVRSLTEHQKSELGYYLPRRENLRAQQNFFNQKQQCYSWAFNWINNQTVNKDTRIVCIGGAINDDIPHVKSNYKFNIDHLSHQYIKLFPEIKNANVKYIASQSENLPFRDNFADMIYSRNSIDHVSNPIETLIEINRILKPDGKFFISVYFDSNFIDSHETTSIDNDFLETHIKNLFDIEWIKISPAQVEGALKLEPFSLPGIKQLSWLYLVLNKKKNFKKYSESELREYAELTEYFHNAQYYYERNELKKAVKFFKKVLEKDPYLKSDENRILYSKIIYLSLTDKDKFKELFSDFKTENIDPFWWKIIIDASLEFMKKDIIKAIKHLLPEKIGAYLIRYIKIKRFKWLDMKGFYFNYLDHLCYRFPIPIQRFYHIFMKKIKNLKLISIFKRYFYD